MNDHHQPQTVKINNVFQSVRASCAEKELLENDWWSFSFVWIYKRKWGVFWDNISWNKLNTLSVDWKFDSTQINLLKGVLKYVCKYYMIFPFPTTSTGETQDLISLSLLVSYLLISRHRNWEQKGYLLASSNETSVETEKGE